MTQTRQPPAATGTHFAVRVHVTLKPVVNDPQGLAVINDAAPPGL